MCSKGCQRGFFYSKEQGRCLECDQNCIACQPNPHYLSTQTREPMSLCLKCRSNGEKYGFFLNSKTRKCSPECTTPNSSPKNVEKIGNETNSLFCVECEVTNCTLCDINNPKKCQECVDGRAPSKKGDSCVKTTTLLYMIRILSILISFTFCFVGLCLIVYKKFRKKIKKRQDPVISYFRIQGEEQNQGKLQTFTIEPVK